MQVTRRLALWAIIVLWVGAVSGCATAPPTQKKVDLDVPETWSVGTGDSESKSPDVWWESFGVAALDTVVVEALQRNHDLQAAAAAVDAAKAQARIAGADRKPQVGAGFQGGKQQQAFVGLPIPGGSGVLSSRSSLYSTGVDISWEPDLWGRLRAGAAAARSDAAAVRADYDGARLSLAGQTVKAWVAVVESRLQVELAQDTVESRRLSSERIAARYRSGVAAPIDLRLARSNQAEAQSAVELRRRQLDASRRQLEVILGRYPAGQIGDEGNLDLPAVPPEIPVGLPAEILARRPDLQAVERRLEAAGYRVREARRSLYPRITLTGSGGASSDSLSDLVGGDFSVWSLAGSLLQPIFQGGRLRAAVEFAESSRERVLAQYAQAVLRAFAEVESALAAETFLASEADAQATATEESKAAARLAEDRYLAGLGDYLAFLESQRRAFAAESRLISLRALLLINRVDLHLALGGDFSGEASREDA